MNILLVFATNSGGTQMVSEEISKVLQAHSQTVTQKMVTDASVDEFNNYDLVILASPSWDFNGMEGMPHEAYLPFMDSAKGKTFEGKKFAIVGLGDSSYTHFCGCADHLEKFVSEMKGVLFTDTLRIDGFFFNQQENLAKVTAWAEQLSSKLQ